MPEGTIALVRREDYLAPAYWIRTADLTFDLDAAKTIVASKLTIERNTSQPAQPLRLHGEDLNLARVLVDGQSVSFRHEDGMLVIDAPAADAFTPDRRCALQIRSPPAKANACVRIAQRKQGWS